MKCCKRLIKRISEHKKCLAIYLCYFLLLLYPFNATISDILYFNRLFLLLSIFIPFLFLFIIDFKKDYLKNKIFICTIFVVLTTFISNYYLIQGRTSRVLLFSMYMFFPYIIFLRKCDIDKIINVIKFFCYEHLFFTYFIVLFKKVYVNSLLPIISNGNTMVQKSLLYWNSEGFNVGITAHYSTNAIYLSIATIFFFSMYLLSNKKKNLILSIFSMLGLILTAKRAHLLFVVITLFLLLMVMLKKYNIKLNLIKISKSVAFITIFLLVISLLLPQIWNVFGRFKDGIINGTLFNGREVFYHSAIEQWLEKPLFGHGWGYFSEYYQNNIYDLSNPAYNREYLDCHNVYIQLLCEFGIIGFIIFVGFMFYIVFKNLKFILMQKANSTILPCLLFSFGYQIFFLLYCMSGNPLYDSQCYVLYFISIGIVLVYMHLNKDIACV